MFGNIRVDRKYLLGRSERNRCLRKGSCTDEAKNLTLAANETMRQTAQRQTFTHNGLRNFTHTKNMLNNKHKTSKLHIVF